MARGKRVGRKPRRRFRPVLLLLALGITLSVVAWGYLVYAAIDFGRSAREGDDDAWSWLGVAAVGAVACLFVGLMLIARLFRALGLTSGPEAASPPQEPPTTAPGSSGPTEGGHRAAR